MVNPVENIGKTLNAFGQQVMLRWTLPIVLPDTYQIIILKKLGSYVSVAEEAAYFATPPPPATPIAGISDMIIDGDSDIDTRGVNDFDVKNGTTYYYTVYVYDVTLDDHSTGEEVSATPVSNYESKIVDAKKVILGVVRRIMNDVGAVENKDYFLHKEYGMPDMKTPSLYVTRVNGSIYQQYIGFFRNTADSYANVVAGNIDTDNIQVTWEDVNVDRRDQLTNLFREKRQMMLDYLLDENGGDMVACDIMIEGDVVNTIVQDRVQTAGMMLFSCIIENTVKYSEDLASWFEFDENVLN